MFWLNHHRSSFFEASKKEQVEAIEKLISQGTFKSGYYVLLILASLIVTCGIFLDNVAVQIGGMILAPLLVPLLSLSLSLVTGNVNGCLRSVGIILLSILIAVVTAGLMTFILSQAFGDVVRTPQGIKPAIYIFIAFCSGIAGAFAWVKEDMAPMIAGVATAVALLPPLCVAGIGLSLARFDLLQEYLVIFIANILGITMAAFLVFWILGFLNVGNVEEKAIKELTD